jgi:hypothetical protein
MAERTGGGSPSEGVPPDRTLNHGSAWVRCEGRPIITEGSGGQITHRAYYRDVVAAAAAAAAGGVPPPPTISAPPEGVRAVIRHVHSAHQRVFEASWKEAGGGDEPPETWKEYLTRKATNISMAKKAAFEFEAVSGPIGIQFGHGFPRIAGIVIGSQADGYSELCEGMELLQIAGHSVAGKSEPECKQLLQDASRPVHLSFGPPPPVSVGVYWVPGSGGGDEFLGEKEIPCDALVAEVIEEHFCQWEHSVDHGGVVQLLRNPSRGRRTRCDVGCHHPAAPLAAFASYNKT